MESKKTPKADLEKRKGLFLELGLLIALGACLVAFNIKSYEMEEVEVSTRTAIDEVDETVIQTQQEETPPPPEPEAPEVVTEVTVVDNDAKIEHELGIVDMGDDASKEVQTFTPVQVEVEKEEVEEEIFTVVENDPEFPGGLEALYKFIGENVKYPQVAKESGITGKVYVQFVVEKNGSVGNVKVLRDIGGGCGTEAVRVVKMLPKWKPGMQRGKAVRVYYTLPVNFSLN